MTTVTKLVAVYHWELIQTRHLCKGTKRTRTVFSQKTLFGFDLQTKNHMCYATSYLFAESCSSVLK